MACECSIVVDQPTTSTTSTILGLTPPAPDLDLVLILTNYLILLNSLELFPRFQEWFQSVSPELGICDVHSKQISDLVTETSNKSKVSGKVKFEKQKRKYVFVFGAPFGDFFRLLFRERFPKCNNATINLILNYICLTFLHCVFSNVSSNCLQGKMCGHTGCICWTFPHCEFSNVDSKILDQSRQSHIGCICWTFPHCAFSNASSNYLHEKIHSHTGCICLTLWVFKCWRKDLGSEQAKSHWLHLFGFSPLCVFKCLLKWPACEDA